MGQLSNLGCPWLNAKEPVMTPEQIQQFETLATEVKAQAQEPPVPAPAPPEQK